MRICILITSEYPYYNGETFIESEIEYLSSIFDEVFCCAVDGRDSSSITRNTPSNVKVIPLNSKKGKYRYFDYLIQGSLRKDETFPIDVKDIKKKLLCTYISGKASFVAKQIEDSVFPFIMKLERNTEILIYSYWFTYHAYAGCLLKKKLIKAGRRVALISRAHRYDLYWEENAFGYIPFQDDMLACLDFLYSCSEHGRIYLKKMYPDKINKIQLARLGTKDYGINYAPRDGAIVIVTCSNLHPVKRVKLFANAFVSLYKNRKNVYWKCIGMGDELSEIKEIIEKGGASNNVDFLLSMPNSKVIEYYRNNPISFFCNVSSSEGVPVSIMEALSFGIPVIATDVGGTSELVDNTVGRIIQKEINAEELANIIRDEIDKPADIYLVKRMNARKRWNEMASASINYKEWINTLEVLLVAMNNESYHS